MKLSPYLNKDLILPDLRSKTKPEVLEELLSPIKPETKGYNRDLALKVLLERENLGTTGIGDGVAIPHGKLDSLQGIIVVVGRSAAGVEFEALDFKPCTIFFMVLAPEQVAGMHLRILAHISRLLKEDNFHRDFLSLGDKDSLWQLLNQT